MNPDLQRPGTPQRRSTYRRRDRKAVENYLKSKYPDSTFHTSKSVENCDVKADFKIIPVPAKSEDANAIVSTSGIKSSPVINHDSCSSPAVHKRGDSKNPEWSYLSNLKQSDLNVCIENSQGTVKEDSVTRNVSIPNKVRMKDHTDVIPSPVTMKLSHVESRQENSTNTESSHPLNAEQSEFGFEYSTSKYLDCAVLNSTFVKSCGVKPRVGNIPVLSEFVGAKTYRPYGKTSLSVMQCCCCSSPVDIKLGDFITPEPTRPIIEKQSDVGVHLENNRERVKENPETRNVSIPKRVRAKDDTDDMLGPPVMKLMLLENYQNDSENSEPLHPTQVKQSEVGVEYLRPSCSKSSPHISKNMKHFDAEHGVGNILVPAESEDVEIVDHTSGKKNSSVNRRCSFPMKNKQRDLKNLKSRCPPIEKKSDIDVCLRNIRGRVKKDPVTQDGTISKTALIKGRTDGRSSTSANKLSCLEKRRGNSKNLEHSNPTMVSPPEVGVDLQNVRGRLKKRNVKPQNFCDSCSSVTASSKDDTAKVPRKVKQSEVADNSRNTKMRLKNGNKKPHNVLYSSSPGTASSKNNAAKVQRKVRQSEVTDDSRNNQWGLKSGKIKRQNVCDSSFPGAASCKNGTAKVPRKVIQSEVADDSRISKRKLKNGTIKPQNARDSGSPGTASSKNGTVKVPRKEKQSEVADDSRHSKKRLKNGTIMPRNARDSGSPGTASSKNGTVKVLRKEKQSEVADDSRSNKRRLKSSTIKPRNVCDSSSLGTASSENDSAKVPRKMTQSEVAKDSRNSERRLKTGTLKPLNFCDSSSPGTASSENDSAKVSRKVRQSEVADDSRNNKRRLKTGTLKPLNFCDSSSPGTASSENDSAKVPRKVGPEAVDNSRNSRRGVKNVKPQNVSYSSSAVTDISKNEQVRVTTCNFDRSVPINELTRYSLPVVNDELASTDQVHNHSTKVKQTDNKVVLKNNQRTQKSCNSEHHSNDSSSQEQPINTDRLTSTPPVEIQDPLVEKLQNVDNHPRAIDPEKSTARSSRKTMNTVVHSTNSEHFVSRNFPAIKLERLKNDLYDTIEKYGYISARRVISEMNVTAGMVKTEAQTKCSEVHTVPSSGGDKLKAKPSRSLRNNITSECCSYSLSNNTKVDTLEEKSKNSGNMNKNECDQDSMPFLGFGSPKKALSTIRHLPKPDPVLTNCNGSRPKRKQPIYKDSSETKVSDCEFIEEIVTNGVKKLEMELHDFRLNQQRLKSKADRKRLFKSKETLVRELPRNRSDSSIRPGIRCTNSRIRRSKHPFNKKKSHHAVGKRFEKVGEVVELLNSEEEQSSGAMVLQPVVLQNFVVEEVVMQNVILSPIVLQPIVLRNLSYQLPSQGLPLVTTHIVPETTSDRWETNKSKEQTDDTISIVSSAESVDSRDFDNERMVQSLIEKEKNRTLRRVSSNYAYSELQGICYVSEEAKSHAPSNIELQDICGVSENPKLRAHSNERNSSKHLDSSPDKQRPNLPDAATVKSLCDGESLSEYDYSDQKEECFTKKETSVSFHSDEKGLFDGTSKVSPSTFTISPIGGDSGKEQILPRIINDFVEEYSGSDVKNQENSLTPNKTQCISPIAVKSTGTLDEESPSQWPSNVNGTIKEKPRILGVPDKPVVKLSYNVHKVNSRCCLPSDLNGLTNQVGDFSPEDSLSDVNSMETGTLAETDSLSEMVSNERVEEEVTSCTSEEPVGKLSLIEASCKASLDNNGTPIQGKYENATAGESEEERIRLSPPKLSSQRPLLVKDSGIKINGIHPIPNPSISPATQIEYVDALDETSKSSLCEISSNEKTEEFRPQFSKPEENLDEKSPYVEESDKSCNKLASDVPANDDEAFDKKENLLATPHFDREKNMVGLGGASVSSLCEISSTGEILEDQNLTRPSIIPIEKLNLDDERREPDSTLPLHDDEVSVEGKGFTRYENCPASSAASDENIQMLFEVQQEQLPSVSSLCNQQVLRSNPEVIHTQFSQPEEKLVEKSPYNEESNESCSKLASDVPVNHEEAFNSDKNLLATSHFDREETMEGLKGATVGSLCEMPSTLEIVEDPKQSRSSKLSIEKVILDDKSVESSSTLSLRDGELSIEGKGSIRCETCPAPSAASYENMKVIFEVHQERLPTSASGLCNRLNDDINGSCTVSSTDRYATVNQDKNQYSSPVESVKNMEVPEEAIEDQLQISTCSLPVEEQSSFWPVEPSGNSNALEETSQSFFDRVSLSEVTKVQQPQRNTPDMFSESSHESFCSSSNHHDSIKDVEGTFVSPSKSIEKEFESERAKKNQLQPRVCDVSVEGSNKESVDPCSELPSGHIDITDQENSFDTVVNHPISFAENLSSNVGSNLSLPDDISLKDGPKGVGSQPSTPCLISENSQESLSDFTSDHHDSTSKDDCFNHSEDRTVSSLETVRNTEGHEDVSGCSVSRISSSDSNHSSNNHDTLEAEISKSTLEIFIEKYPLDANRVCNEIPLEYNVPRSQDERFAQVELQSGSPDKFTLENAVASSVVFGETVNNRGDRIENSFCQTSKQIQSSTFDVSNVRSLHSEENQKSFFKSLLPSCLNEKLSEPIVIPEKKPITSSESTMKQPSSETGMVSFSQTTTYRDYPSKLSSLSPEQSKPSSSRGKYSLDDVFGISFKQALAGGESTNEDHFIPESGCPPSSCKSAENPSVTGSRNSKHCSSYDSTHHWENAVSGLTDHCDGYVRNHSAERLITESKQIVSRSHVPQNNLIAEHGNESMFSVLSADNESLIEDRHSSKSVANEPENILEESLVIDHPSTCNDEYLDEGEEAVTSFSENTFSHVNEPLVGLNVDYEELKKKCLEENEPADFLEMSDYTEALVDACLRENLPGSSEDCIPTMHVVESADFPCVSSANEVLEEPARDSGQLAETGVIATLPEEFANECFSLHRLPTISNSVDIGDQNISSLSSIISSQPSELIFDGFFMTDEPINLPSEGDLSAEICQYNSKLEDIQPTLMHESLEKNSDPAKMLNITGRETKVVTDFSKQPSLNLSQPERLLSASEQARVGASSTNDVSVKKCEVGESVFWQSRDVSLTVVPQVEGVDQFKKTDCKIDELLFDEEFEPNNNLTPTKDTRVGKRILPGTSVASSSDPSGLLYDEEFESSNNSTPVRKMRVGPSVTVSRVCARSLSDLLYDEEFEQSNNVSPVEEPIVDVTRLPAESQHCVMSVGSVNQLVIDENDEPPLNATRDSLNDVNEQTVARRLTAGCVVISSDEESENLRINYNSDYIPTNSPKHIHRPPRCVSNETVGIHHYRQIGEKSKREPIATSSPKIVGEPNGGHPSERHSAGLSPITEEVIPEYVDLSETESENERINSPHRKIIKLSVGDNKTLELQKPEEADSSSDRLKGGDEGNCSKGGSPERQSKTYWSHCAPIELDDVNLVEKSGSDDETDSELQNPLLCSASIPEKLNKSVRVKSSKVEKESEDVIELTDSDIENSSAEVSGPVLCSSDELPIEYLDELIESDDSYKDKEVVQAMPQNLPKPLTSKKPLLSIQRQNFIKTYSEQLVKLAEKIYRKPKTSILKKPLTRSQLTDKKSLVLSDSEHSSDSTSVDDSSESDNFFSSGDEEEVSSTSPSYSLSSRKKTSIKSTSTLRNSAVARVSAMKSKVVRPSSSRHSLKSPIYDNSDDVGSDGDGRTTRVLLSSRPLKVLRKPDLVNETKVPSKTAAPPTLHKESSSSSICRTSTPLDDKSNHGYGSHIVNDSSRISSPEVLASNPVISTQFQNIVNESASVNFRSSRIANTAKKTKTLLNERLACSASQGTSNNVISSSRFVKRSGDELFVSSKPPSSEPGASMRSKKKPVTTKRRRLSEITAMSWPTSERIPPSSASELASKFKKQAATTQQPKQLLQQENQEIDAGHLSDDAQQLLSCHLYSPESDDDSSNLTKPDFLSSKLVLSRQSLNFINSITRNQSKSLNPAPQQLKLPVNQISSRRKTYRKKKNSQQSPSNQVIS